MTDAACAPWTTECIDGVWYAIRSGAWAARVRITPSNTEACDDVRDRQRAEMVVATLNRIAT